LAKLEVRHLLSAIQNGVPRRIRRVFRLQCGSTPWNGACSPRFPQRARGGRPVQRPVLYRSRERIPRRCGHPILDARRRNRLEARARPAHVSGLPVPRAQRSRARICWNVSSQPPRGHCCD